MKFRSVGPGMVGWMALAIPLFVLGGLFLDFRAHDRRVVLEEKRGTPYVGSETCGLCHAEHFRSWARTYHRTMTRTIGADSLKAPIRDGLRLNVEGIDIQFHENDGHYEVTLPAPNGVIQTLPLVYTIGSRRMQQLAVRVGDQIQRLPVFYQLEDRMWLPINEAFFRPRGGGLAHFLKGYALWNGNCIFCHNTRPDPGMAYPDWRFDSKVAEHGIACEECHGPGAIHAQRNHNPLRRYLNALLHREDGGIIQPASLSAARSVQICGQCHGQRLPNPRDRIRELMERGDPYLAGEDLARYYTPLTAHTPLDGQEHLRFWPDGSPRLTAYELQAVTGSRCYTQSRSFTCISCHDMHGGRPEGMIRERNLDGAPCLECHPDQAGASHSHHGAAEANCYDCHMPDTVYGVMRIHPTHLIRNPDPGRTLRFNMPNACNNCHLDRSVNWSVKWMNTWWEKNLSGGGTSFDLPEIARGFSSGDAVYRFILLERMNQQDLTGFEFLLGAALEDPFPVVAHAAKRWLRRHRGTSIDLPAEAIGSLGLPPLPPIYRDLLQTRRPEQAIEFGE